jgi:hypothetical protein
MSFLAKMCGKNTAKYNSWTMNDTEGPGIARLYMPSR